MRHTLSKQHEEGVRRDEDGRLGRVLVPVPGGERCTNHTRPVEIR